MTLTTQRPTRPATMRRMAKPPMTQKTYRVPVALYERAMERAEANEENLSDVIRRALEQYANGYRCRFCGNEVAHQRDLCDDCQRKIIGPALGITQEDEASRTS